MTSYKSNSVKIGSAVLARELSKYRVTKKGKKTKKSRESNISPSCRDAPTGAIAVIFGVRGDIAVIITHTKFYVNRFRGFGILTPPILPFSIGLAGCPYNSVSTTVLHCDTYIHTYIHNVRTWSQLPTNSNKWVFSFCLKTGNVRSGRHSSGGIDRSTTGDRRPWRFCLRIGCVCVAHATFGYHWSQSAVVDIGQLTTVVSEACGHRAPASDWWTNPAILKMVHLEHLVRCICVRTIVSEWYSSEYFRNGTSAYYRPFSAINGG